MADIYHVLNRGVDKRKIFLDQQDHLRFIHDLYEFNDNRVIGSTSDRFKASNKDNDLVGRSTKQPRKPMVNIYAFCLMPNHFHLLLGPIIENGISKFLRKLDMGYAKYFNIKHKRKGALFESRYKSILISKSNHFLNLPYYIHLNPLDMEFSEWRNRKIKDHDKAIKYLNNYRWSSHLDYCGKKNFPSVTNRELLLDVFGGQEKYKKDINKWLEEMKIDNIGE
ncbi:MAG: transposase [Patescibacteria group bacterium]